MAKTNPSVDEYLRAQPKDVRATLQTVRAAIRRALPDAEERISYQIPGYRTDAGTVIYFAGWKQHYSIYPVGPSLAARFDGALEPYQAQKDTLRFALTEPVPTELIERVALLRAIEASEYVAAKRAAKGARAAKKKAAADTAVKKTAVKKTAVKKTAVKSKAAVKTAAVKGNTARRRA